MPVLVYISILRDISPQWEIILVQFLLHFKQWMMIFQISVFLFLSWRNLKYSGQVDPVPFNYKFGDLFNAFSTSVFGTAPSSSPAACDFGALQGSFVKLCLLPGCWLWHQS